MNPKIRLFNSWTRGGKWKAGRPGGGPSVPWYEQLSPSLSRYIILENKAELCEYNPMKEAPDAYLKFIRLGEPKRFGSEKNYIKAVLHFLTGHGPLFPFVYRKDMSQTVAWLSYEASVMNQAMKVSQLIEKFPFSDSLKDYSETLVRNKTWEFDYDIPNILVANKESIRLPKYKPSGKPGEVEEWGGPITAPKGKDEIIEFAVLNLETVINTYLYGQVFPMLGNRMEENESYSGIWVQGYGFTNLLAVLWLQFYLGITERVVVRECANEKCRNDRYFKPVRSDQQYCCVSCRVAQHKRKI